MRRRLLHASPATGGGISTSAAMCESPYYPMPVYKVYRWESSRQHIAAEYEIFTYRKYFQIIMPLVTDLFFYIISIIVCDVHKINPTISCVIRIADHQRQLYPARRTIGKTDHNNSRPGDVVKIERTVIYSGLYAQCREKHIEPLTQYIFFFVKKIVV